jgi:hypothetical protein
VPFPDSYCRDGSNAGIAVIFSSASNKLMIYLEGGGACFDSLTCLANPSSVGTQMNAQTGGVWDRSNAMNPVKDWNAVYIPYCTGDIHSGTNPNGMVSGVSGMQMFVGRKNLEAYLNRIVPTFPNVTQLLLTGMSAGGFGSAANALLFQRAFPNVKGNLIDDSGPPMSDTQVPPCMQDAWRTLWGLDGSILADCGSHCPNNMDYVLDFAKYEASLFTDRMSGLLDSNDDSVITQFFGIGNDSGKNDCGGTFGLTPVSAADYQAGLDNFRSVITAIDPNFGTYYPVSTQHVWINGVSFYTETQDGTSLVDWFTKIVNNQSVSQVGP